MKDGRTHLAYKPEHAVDLDTGAIVAAAIHPADQGDTDDPAGRRWRRPQTQPGGGRAAPTPEDPAELVADKGYHSRDGLKDLDDGAWKTRIAEKKPRQRLSALAWRRGGPRGRSTTTAPGCDRASARRRSSAAELVERSFAHVLDRGGMRRAWLRGRENLHKRYLVHVAGYNLGLIMRLWSEPAPQGRPRQSKMRSCSSFKAPTRLPSCWLLRSTQRSPPSSSPSPQTPSDQFQTSSPGAGKEAAPSLGVTLQIQDIRTADGSLAAAFDARARERAEGTAPRPPRASSLLTAHG